jgi:outer membrane protein assembly factor BamB
VTIDQLIFIGLNGYALALNRDTGEIVWSNNELNSGPVTLLLDGDRLIVSTGGYMFCLNPLTGEVLWNNPLSGYGMAAPTAIVSVRGQTSLVLAHVPESNDTVTAAAVAGGAATASSN